ncbi:cysteine desulfurase family protein [Kaistia dalseonensis]|uniref:Cysteine desulfurase n=1 Tax=Kaistia dalseonensis TaxID=410840 RepID=A0ABU0H187_9HYPH|nr:cysteine desulfurase family protein [Kaistia dalseonensis]MCX5493514.1 cysteine desulfurase family protein [Kaistia dalseonensis]MDQ0436074.1 cysteine desulfurase [Kaistia dalseonensis]
MARERIYLDYNAGAPLRADVRAAMIEWLAMTGNASSVHAEGRAARARIEKARRQVAALVGGDPDRVIFTSGGTEANVTVLSPAIRVGAGAISVDMLLVGASEHPSVLAGGRFPADRVETIPVDGDGLIDLAALEARLDGLARSGKRALVSVMLANNETGTIQPVAAVAAIARRHGALVHSDAVQASGRIPVDIAALGVDFLTLSAHKIGGPQGAGAIVLGGDLASPAPLLVGGGQEKYSRAGTQNVVAIAGFGLAAELARTDLERMAHWADWRAAIAAAAGPARVLSAGAPCLPQTIALAAEGLSAETLVIALDLEGIAISAGSACSSGKVAVSHVMKAMNVPESHAKAAIRVSFGWETSENDIRRFTEVWGRVMERLAPAKTIAA